jgi:hypothetical protein
VTYAEPLPIRHDQVESQLVLGRLSKHFVGCIHSSILKNLISKIFYNFTISLCLTRSGVVAIIVVLVDSMKVCATAIESNEKATFM